MVYHMGQHKCEHKPKRNDDVNYLEDEIRRYGTNVGPNEVARLQMKDELSRQLKTGAHDMSIISGIAAKFTDRKKIENIQRRIQNEMKSERHSISAVAELKEVTDTSDNLLDSPVAQLVEHSKLN